MNKSNTESVPDPTFFARGWLRQTNINHCDCTVQPTVKQTNNLGASPNEIIVRIVMLGEEGGDWAVTLKLQLREFCVSGIGAGMLQQTGKRCLPSI